MNEECMMTFQVMIMVMVMMIDERLTALPTMNNDDGAGGRAKREGLRDAE